MFEHYNQKYTIEEIDDILNVIKNCIKNNNYTIEVNKNRQENIKFIQEYNLNYNKRKKILLNIKTTDFCHSLQNTNIGYEYETLYVFCCQSVVFNIYGEEEFVDIYIKFNIVEYGDNKKVITISFHKRNKPIKYLFR